MNLYEQVLKKIAYLFCCFYNLNFNIFLIFCNFFMMNHVNVSIICWKKKKKNKYVPKFNGEN